MDYSLTSVTIQQIHIFVHVAEAPGFARAASALHMTQSAVSKSVATLEKTLGIRLFDRTTRTLRLTEAGEYLYREWKKQLLSLQEAYRFASDLDKKIHNTLKLGLLNTARPDFYLPALMEAFYAEHPDISVEIEARYMTDLEDALEAGEYDMILVPDFERFYLEKRKMMWKYFAVEPAEIIISSRHPLAEKASVCTKDIAKYPFAAIVTHEHDLAYVQDLKERLRSHNKEPQIVTHFKTAYDIRYLYRGPDSAVLLTDHYFEFPETDTNFVRLPVTDQKNGIICAWNPGRDSPNLSTFLNSIPDYDI